MSTCPEDAKYQKLFDMGVKLSDKLILDLDTALLTRDDGSEASRDQLLGLKLMILSGAVDRLITAYEAVNP